MLSKTSPESTCAHLGEVRIKSARLIVSRFVNYPYFNDNARILMDARPKARFGSELEMFQGLDSPADCDAWEGAYRVSLHECAMRLLNIEDPADVPPSVYWPLMDAIHRDELLGRNKRAKAKRYKVPADISGLVSDKVGDIAKDVERDLNMRSFPTAITRPATVLPGQLFGRESDLSTQILVPTGIVAGSCERAANQLRRA